MKRTIIGAVLAGVLLAGGEAWGQGCGLHKYARDSTYLYDRRSEQWEQCPGDSWAWAETPNRHGFRVHGGGQNCRSFQKQHEWAQYWMEGKELAQQRGYLSALERAVKQYAEHTGKRKVHGRSLHRYLCKQY